MNAYLCVMANFSEQVETQSLLYPSSAPSSLSSIAFGNKRFYKAADLSFLIEPINAYKSGLQKLFIKDKPHFAILSRINYTSDVWDCYTGFCDICCWDKKVRIMCQLN